MSNEARANDYPAPHLLTVLNEPFLVRRMKVREDIVKWYIKDPAILRRLGKDDESRRPVRSDYRAGIDSNPVWKHGFFDITGFILNRS